MMAETGSKPAAPGRLVLALAPDGVSDANLAEAAELARALRMELLALFLEDEASFNAVAHDFTSEVAYGVAAPRKVDAGRLEADFQSLAQRFERRMIAIADRTHATIRFERVRGQPAVAVPSRLGAGDYLVLFEPARPSDRILGPHAALARCAEGLCAAVVMPARMASGRGAVVAIRDDAPASDAPASDSAAGAVSPPETAGLALARAIATAFGGAARSCPVSQAAEALRGARLAIIGPDLSGPSREAAMRAARRAGVPLLTLASSGDTPAPIASTQ